MPGSTQRVLSRALCGGAVRFMLSMVQAAMLGEGIALAPHDLFRREIDSGQIVRPFAIEALVDGYWLTRLKSRPPSSAMLRFQTWLLGEFAGDLADRPAADRLR